MIQFCVMSAHEGRLGSEKKIYITFMAGCGLVRPTYARQLLAQRRNAQDGQPQRRGQFFLTIMGATEIASPTLAEEFLDLRELIKTGALTPEDWDRGLVQAGQPDVTISSFTLMAGFSEIELPSENAEADALALQQHLGSIPENVGQVLQLGVGQQEAERRATVRRALEVARLA